MSGFGGASGWRGGGGGTRTPPPRPGLALVSVGNGQVTLHYTAATGQTAGEINYDDGVTPGSFATAGTGNYTITGLTSGTKYYFTAEAQNSGAWSYPTPTVVATPLGASSQYDENFEAYIGLSLKHELQAIAALSTYPLQTLGARIPPVDSVKQWLALDILSFPRKPSRIRVWRGAVLFQVTCFSRDGAERTDKQTDFPLRVAGIVARSLENKHFNIQTYGATSLTRVADLGIDVPKIVNIPPLKGTNVWATALTFNGYINTH